MYMKYLFVCNSYLKTDGGSPFILFSLKDQIKNPCYTANVCRDLQGKLECGDFKFTEIACIPAMPAKIIRKFEKS